MLEDSGDDLDKKYTPRERSEIVRLKEFEPKYPFEALCFMWTARGSADKLKKEIEKAYEILLKHSSTKTFENLSSKSDATFPDERKSLYFDMVSSSFYDPPKNQTEYEKLFIRPPKKGNARAKQLVETTLGVPVPLFDNRDLHVLVAESVENLIYSARFGINANAAWRKVDDAVPHLSKMNVLEWIDIYEDLRTPAFYVDEEGNFDKKRSVAIHKALMLEAVRSDFLVLPPKYGMLNPWLGQNGFDFNFTVDPLNSSVLVANCGVFMRDGIVLDARLWVLKGIFITVFNHTKNTTSFFSKEFNNHMHDLQNVRLKTNLDGSEQSEGDKMKASAAETVYEDGRLMKGQFMTEEISFLSNPLLPWSAVAEFVFINQGGLETSTDVSVNPDQIKRRSRDSKHPYSYFVMTLKSKQ